MCAKNWDKLHCVCHDTHARIVVLNTQGSVPSFTPSFSQKTALRAPCDSVLVDKNNCFEQCCATSCRHQVSVTMSHVFLSSSLCFFSPVAPHCETVPLVGTSHNHCHSCKVWCNQTTKKATFEVTVVKAKSSLLTFCKQSSECKDHLHHWEQWLTLTWSVSRTDVRVISPSKNQLFSLTNNEEQRKQITWNLCCTFLSHSTKKSIQLSSFATLEAWLTLKIN